MHTEAIKRATGICGGISALARAIGVKAPTVFQWVYGDRPVPAERCRSIESATGGQITRYELRPDVFGPAPDRKEAA